MYVLVSITGCLYPEALSCGTRGTLIDMHTHAEMSDVRSGGVSKGNSTRLELFIYITESRSNKD